MVYYGKPSKACLECRLRRTRCDSLLPSCSQCVRASRVCGGYRDPSESIFWDESLNVQKKHQGKQKKSMTKCSFDHSQTSLDPEANVKNIGTSTFRLSALSLSMANISLPPGAGASVEDQAMSFFFSNYILTDDKHRYGYFQYLQDICATEQIGTALSDILVALGLAGLSNLWKSPNIMMIANGKYTSAVRLVNSQLSDSRESKSDQTFVTVMALSLYETNTCCRPSSMKSWTEHINGAVQILYLRGKERLQTPIGRRLFIHLRALVIANCIQRQVPVPSTISEWSNSVLSDDETMEEACYTALSQLITNFANIRATLSSFRDYTNYEHIITTLQALDLEYKNWLQTCPKSFEYITVPLGQRSTEVFSDHYHIYSSMTAAAVLNNYRCVRILINEVILAQLNYKIRILEQSATRVHYSLWEQQTQTLDVILQLSHDICASVPFFLGYPNLMSGTDGLPPKAITGNMLIWPLYIAACTGLVSDVMRVWIMGRLMLISNVLGVGQAAPLAHTLGVNQNLLEWVASG